MKQLLILVLLSLFLIPAFGQKINRDIVYLKTGAVIKGLVIINDGKKVKINSSGNEWVFRAEEVDSVIRHSKGTQISGFNKKYFLDTSMGVLVGNSGNEQKAPFSFMTSYNYQIHDKLFVGAGLGAEFLAETYMPTFAQVQYRFRNTKITPFVNLQLGYQVPLEKESRDYSNNYYVNYSSDYYPGYYTNQKLQTEGGILINPSFGFQKFTSENYGWFFSFGYRYHQLNYSGENDYKLEKNYSRLSLKIGFIFN